MRRKSPEWEQNGHTRPSVHQSGGLIEKRERGGEGERWVEGEKGEVVSMVATCHLADNSLASFQMQMRGKTMRFHRK